MEKSITSLSIDNMSSERRLELLGFLSLKLCENKIQFKRGMHIVQDLGLVERGLVSRPVILLAQTVWDAFHSSECKKDSIYFVLSETPKALLGILGTLKDTTN